MNWGNKLLLTFLAFAALMATMVYKSYHTKTELVSPEYYKDELEYQKVINGSRNLSGLSEALKIEQSGKRIKLILPGETSPEKISGNVWLYCAYDSKNDLRFPLNINYSGEMIFDSNRLNPGEYTLKVSLDNKGTNYFIQKEISITP